MCGRFITKDEAAAEREMEIGRRNPPNWFKDSYNVAPSQQVPVVRMDDGERLGCLMRWGLVPFWAKGIPPKYHTINARIETLETAASYRGPWKHGKRCIMVCSGFYEWHVQVDGTKQPYFIRLKNRDVFGFAALWDSSTTDEGVTVESCTIITMDANPFMAEIHNDKKRMPAILAHEDHQAWLSGNHHQALAALKQYPDDGLVAWPISKAVNVPKNNGPELIEALTI
jgi:putative SOS response-associated peptidase YedK